MALSFLAFKPTGAANAIAISREIIVKALAIFCIPMFAPWAGEGNRYVSIKLPDGAELEPDTLYTVAFWNGCVDPALIDAVEAEYEDTAADLLKEWIELQGSSIKPDHKDFILDWTIMESNVD